MLKLLSLCHIFNILSFNIWLYNKPVNLIFIPKLIKHVRAVEQRHVINNLDCKIKYSFRRCQNII